MENRRYLLVDDNEPLAENLAEILRSRGNQVDVATSGETALAALGRTRYDALITDMKMPGMSGADLVRAARGADPGLPLVVMTAYSGDQQLRDAQEDGLLAVLPKPVPIARFCNLLRVARRGGFVLLLEADPALAETLGEALRTRGLTPLPAASGEEASQLAEARVEPIGGVVDLVPAEGPGTALGRLSERFPALPLMVISGQSGELAPVRAREVFRRPVDPTRVAEALEREVGAA